jgi:D-xylose transport system ATP-binding protein
MPMTENQSPLVLAARGISKRFGWVRALSDVSIEVYEGSVVALLGDNGAGKSTLLKIIAGVHQPDEGEIWFASRHVNIGSPKIASNLGIETVYQDLALCDNLDVVENLFLGRERRWPDLPLLGRFLAGERMRRESAEALALLGVRLPSLAMRVGALSGGQRQAIAVARAGMWGARLVMLDEPTAALGVKQAARVHNLIRRLRERGVGIVLVTHNLPDAFALADQLVVLRQGQLVATLDPSRTTPGKVIGVIMGDTSATGTIAP